MFFKELLNANTDCEADGSALKMGNDKKVMKPRIHVPYTRF